MPTLTKQEAELIKEIALDFVRLGKENLADVVIAVREAVKDALGIDLSDQDIYDAISTTGTSRPRSEIAKQIADLKKEARKLSTEQKNKRLDKAAERLTSDPITKKLADVQAQINDLKSQLETGDYQVKQVKRAKAIQQLEDLRAERDMYASRVRRAVKDHQTSFGKKAARQTAETIRGTILGSDIGILTRQGMYAWARPKIALKAVGKAGKAMFSEKEAVKAMRAIDERRLKDGASAAVVRKKAGLSLSDRVLDPEELSVARLIQKIPWVGERIGGGLDRFQHVFINQVRADTFDMAANLGFSEKELATRARFINNATGRGNIKNVPESLQLVMTSPRYEASRWAMIGEYLRNPVEAIKNKGARENLKDLGANAATIFALYKTAELAGYEVEYDPSSSDFLKLRKGEEVWDPTAGIATRLKDVVRFAVYFANPEYMRTPVHQTGESLIRTFSPAITTPANFAAIKTQEAMGEDEPKGIRGFIASNEEKGWMAFSPLIMQSFFRTLDEEGVGKAASAAIREFIGQSVNRYPKAKSTPLDRLSEN